MSYSGHIPDEFYGKDRERAIIATDFHTWEADKYIGGSEDEYIEYVQDRMNSAGEFFDVERFLNLGDTGSWDMVRKLSEGLDFDKIEHLEGDEDRVNGHNRSYRGWAETHSYGKKETENAEFHLRPSAWQMNLFPHYDINLQHFPRCQGNETRATNFQVDPTHEHLTYVFDNDKDVSPSMANPAVNFHGHSHIDSTRHIWNSIVNSVGGFKNPYQMNKYQNTNPFKIASFGREKVDILTLDAKNQEVIGTNSYELRDTNRVQRELQDSTEITRMEDEDTGRVSLETVPVKHEVSETKRFVETDSTGKGAEDHRDFLNRAAIPEAYSHPVYMDVLETTRKNR